MGSRTFQIGGVLFLFASVAFAQVSYAPLFVIERNTNANVVHYEAKLKDGHIDQHQPVIAYWIMGAEDGRRQELNLLEKVKAYGFNIHPDSVPDSYRMVIVSDKKKEIHVLRVGNSVRAEVNIGACNAALQKIFISARKSFLIGLPEYAEMLGTDLTSGGQCTERITPGER